MSILIGIDIGGTFTDIVAFDTEEKRLAVTKVPTTPQDHAMGFKQGLEKIIAMSGLDIRRIEGIFHGTTVGTNALLERKGSNMGILTTEGFEDVLVIGRQKRSEMYNLFIETETPVFLARRKRIIGIPERINFQGKVLKKLNRASVEESLKQFVADGVNSIAVCYLFSFLNPEHENQTRAIIAKGWPNIRISLSSRLDPRFREYERLCVTAFDAYIGPIIEEYLRNIEKEIRSIGIKAKLHVMQSRGGITGAETVMEKAVSTILSGPAAGVVGSNFIGKAIGEKNLITLDIGGTSCDVALIQDAKPVLTNDGKIDKYPLRVPMLDINTIGAGGGSIVWMDEAGGIRVGPISAGAIPGPACYGLGGAQPTVTDASVALGYLNPYFFAGGALELKSQLAEKVIAERVANPLGFGVQETAMGIHRIINSKMADQLRLISIGKGQDPRKFSLMAFGGGGPVHAGQIAELLSIKKVIVPLSPGVLAAFGLLVADIEHDYGKTMIIKTEKADPIFLQRIFRELDGICSKKMSKDNIPLQEVKLRYFAEMRYVGQAYELEIALPTGRFNAESIREGVNRFHKAHEAIYGHFDASSPVEFVSFRSVHTYSQPKPILSKSQRSGKLSDALKGTREAYFKENRPVRTPVYDRWKIPSGDLIKGPAIIEQEDTTTVIYHDQNAYLDSYKNIIIEIPSK